MNLKNSILLIIAFSVLSACQFLEEDGSKIDLPQAEKESVDLIPFSEIEYDLSCMSGEDEKTIGFINLLSQGKDKLVEMFAGDITAEEEMQLGKEFHEEYQKEVKISKNKSLEKYVAKLIKTLPESKYTYHIFEVEEEVINAFTIGGYIYIFKGMLDFVETEDELMAVIAHEISHNELGHINKKLGMNKITTNIFGEEYGETAVVIQNILTMPFGQKDEVMADLLGVDLMLQSKYNACEAIKLWNKMAENEQKIPYLEIISSHPYSAKRAVCIKNHVFKNYNVSCE